MFKKTRVRQIIELLQKKPSVEDSVGKIARKIIGMFRNETFRSLEALNRGIGEVLDKLNSKEFQKRNGSRKIIFETEEKPMLRTLPLMPFEICEWSYHHKAGPNSHIWFDKGQYSVPGDYLNRRVDVRYNNAMVYIYSSHKLITEHKRLPAGIKNGKRTETARLPYLLYVPETVESTTAKAEKTGTNTKNVVCRIYDNAKIKEQTLMDVRTILDIAGISLETLDCEARSISREVIVNLASMGFVSAATNLIITGATGTGKTYLSCVLGVEACKQTLRTCYIRMPDMLGHFQSHKDNLREQTRYRKRLGNYKILIIDEWLNYKINERESKFIYELIEHRQIP